MIREPIEGRVFHLFAELLDYPRTPLAGAAGECAVLVAASSPEAAADLREFESFAAATPLARLEEVYTGVFELDATCHPYIGYHLFGESYKRSVFLLALKEHYRFCGIECGVELPDHLAMVLRFLAASGNPAEAEEMVREALHPALRKMLKSEGEEPPDPDIPKLPARGAEYRRVLQALRSVLLTIAPEDVVMASEPGADNPLPKAGDGTHPGS